MIKLAVIEDSRAVLSVSVYQSFLKETEFELHSFNSSVSDINRLIGAGDFDIVICPSFPKFQNGPDIVFIVKRRLLLPA